MANTNIKKFFLAALPLTLIATYLWQSEPEGLNAQGWHMLLIFSATILMIMTNALPMGMVTILAIIITTITDTFPLKTMLSGFGSDVVWLVIAAFMIARAVIQTGLGYRVAHFFIGILGKTPIGLSYGLILTELILAPAIPSASARGGGLLYPIVKSIANSYDSREGQVNKIGSFFTLTAFHTNIITSAMFLTAMAGNPLVTKFASAYGITITWGTWALGAFVPGICALAILPLVLHTLCKPKVITNKDILALTKEARKMMGKPNKKEIITSVVFVALIMMWSGEKYIGVDPTATALIGCMSLLITRVLTWQDVTNERGAWDTLLWFGAMISMATALSSTGAINWLSQKMMMVTNNLDSITAIILLSCSFFYIHYFFASITVHMTVMYSAFLGVFLSLGLPTIPSAMALAALSILSAGLTHYGISSAPIIFSSGYTSVGRWWGISLITSFIYVIVWVSVGFIWWRVLGWIN